MGIKRIVDTAFWTDGKVDEFSPEDKYFMLYLLTNPFTTQLGIYEISIKQVSFQMGYSMDAVKVLLDRFENKYDLIFFSPKTNEIAIKNFLRHSIIKGGAPVRDCLVKELKKVKNRRLIVQVFSHIKGDEGLNETVKKIIDEYEEKNGDLYYSNSNIKNNNDIKKDNENENDNEVSWHDSSTIRSIVDYLNQKAKVHYKATTKKTQTCIHARLSEGFTIDDFKTVIDKKCDEWLKTDFEQYLRPETLFGTKFESYLNAKVTQKQKEKESFASYDLEAYERMLNKPDPPTAADDVNIRARAEALQKELSN